MEKQTRFEDRRELIFNSSAKSVKSAQVHEKDVTNDQVDLEIILLGPKANKNKHDNRPSNSTRSNKSDEDLDLEELDPYRPARESSPVRDVEDNSKSLTKTEPPSSNPTSREHDREPSTVIRSANNISSSLLDLMERQFRENISSRANDEEQVDYLDYF